MKPTKELTLGSVYPTKDGRWRAAITIGYDGRGKRVRRTVSAKSKSAVLRKRNDLYLELQQGNSTKSDSTVQGWVQKWLETTAFESYSPNQLSNVRSHARRYIVPTLGQYALRDVGADEVRELDQAVRRAGVSDRTVQTVRSTLSVCMADAVRAGYLTVNPCDMVAHPRAVSEKRAPLTVAQARSLIVDSSKRGDPLATLWASYLFLAPRKNELLGMEWSRVDLDAGAMDLSWSMGQVPWAHGPGCKCAAGVNPAKCDHRVHRIPPGFEARELRGTLMWTRPKTKASQRVIPLPGVLVDALRLHKEMHAQNEYGLVWTGVKGGPLRPDIALKRWKKALAHAGLPVVDLHSARHTTSSLLRETGVAPEIIARILGHTKVDTTFGYIHVHDGQTRSAMDSLESFIGIPRP